MDQADSLLLLTEYSVAIIAVSLFGGWLPSIFRLTHTRTQVVTSFVADIDVVADLHLQRYRYIKMCGDIAKHNLARLSTNVGHLQKLLKKANHPVTEQEAYLAIENFFEWFFDDIFIYHSSQIAEFLNNIRWAIFEYLQPEFQRSWHLTEHATPSFPMYGYRIPAESTEPIAQAMYWDVMNRVRAKPWIHRFVISDDFKRRY